jgi:outer membrane protein assembly factor BamB
MRIKWTLRLVTGTVSRERDVQSVNTTVYGTTSGDAMVGVHTTHSKQLWVQTADGRLISALLNNSEKVSAAPGDRVRVVFADPGGHVVGLANETLQTSWTWKYPSKSGFLALLAPLLFLGLLIVGLIALWRGNLSPAVICLSIVAYVYLVPLGHNRRRVRELHRERQEMLSAPNEATAANPGHEAAPC